MRRKDGIVPIEILRVQINRDYYQLHMTLNEIFRKYRRYDPEDIKGILGVYDLANEPEPANETTTMNVKMRREWNAECRRLNPKAWERKRHG